MLINVNHKNQLKLEISTKNKIKKLKNLMKQQQ